MNNVMWFRRAFITVVLLGLIGLSAELFSVGHYYGPGQMIPFVLMGLTLIGGLWVLFSDGQAALWTVRVLAILLLLGGLYGAVKHTGAEADLRQAGRQNELAKPPEPDAKPLLGLPAPTANVLNGPAPLSAPLSMSGLGLLLFLALYRREQDAELGQSLARPVSTD